MDANMPVSRPGGLDRLTMLVAGGVAVLTVVALATAIIARPSQSPDLSRPEGVVAAFVQAVQAGKGEQAWALIAPGSTQGGTRGPTGGPIFTKDEFQREVDAIPSGSRSRVRIVDTTTSGDTATVRLEVTSFPGGPFGGASSNTVTVTLGRQGSSWLVTSDPSPWHFS